MGGCLSKSRLFDRIANTHNICVSTTLPNKNSIDHLQQNDIERNKVSNNSSRTRCSTRVYDVIGPSELAIYRVSSGSSLNNLSISQASHAGRSPVSIQSNMNNKLNNNVIVTTSNQSRVVGFTSTNIQNGSDYMSDKTKVSNERSLLTEILLKNISKG